MRPVHRSHHRTGQLAVVVGIVQAVDLVVAAHNHLRTDQAVDLAVAAHNRLHTVPAADQAVAASSHLHIVPAADPVVTDIGQVADLVVVARSLARKERPAEGMETLSHCQSEVEHCVA